MQSVTSHIEVGKTNSKGIVRLFIQRSRFVEQMEKSASLFCERISIEIVV